MTTHAFLHNILNTFEIMCYWIWTINSLSISCYCSTYCVCLVTEFHTRSIYFWRNSRNSLPQHRINSIYIVPDRRLFYLLVKISSVDVKWPQAKISLFRSDCLGFSLKRAQHLKNYFQFLLKGFSVIAVIVWNNVTLQTEKT